MSKFILHIHHPTHTRARQARMHIPQASGTSKDSNSNYQHTQAKKKVCKTL